MNAGSYYALPSGSGWGIYRRGTLLGTTGDLSDARGLVDVMNARRAGVMIRALGGPGLLKGRPLWSEYQT